LPYGFGKTLVKVLQAGQPIPSAAANSSTWVGLKLKRRRQSCAATAQDALLRSERLALSAYGGTNNKPDWRID
jgi:hypothetical protein